MSSSLEDYLEAILNVADDSGMARSKDIAASLAVAKPSVTGALKLLAKKGLVNYRPYGYVTLTQSGLAQAAKVAKKHDIIKSFLTDILGVDGPAAQKAACKAEHLLGPAIISRMSDFTNFAKKQARRGENVMDVLGRFAKAKRPKD
ncbi:MAG: metal-dependent transcriptional regulator [Sedimentisphaerales bacterium]|nr:metal-dependent transcriptional regulator [Sedimentisphaerales bacterium]